MAQTSKPDLNLWVLGQEDSTYTWALDPPPGRDSFRIVVHCRQAQDATSPKPRYGVDPETERLSPQTFESAPR
jgi:hypothetical protein